MVALLPVAHAATKSPTCKTREECCQLCGADSYRCARGPCSASFITKGFFSISLPTEDVGFWDVVFSFYGMVPYLVPIAIALEFLLHKRSWARLFSFFFIPIVAVINAGIFSILGFGRGWPTARKILFNAGTILLFVPVPYSRVYLGDHTSLQVTIGSANGLVFGAIYFVILRFVIAKRIDGALSRWRVHNDFTTQHKLSASPTSGDALLEHAATPTHYLAKEFFSFSLPTDGLSAADVVAVAYSMVPYLVLFSLLLNFVIRRKTWTRLLALLFIPIMSAINAVLFVPSWGSCAECSRPCGSCIGVRGMPSGHSTNSIGFCLWVFLESLLGVGRLRGWSWRRVLLVNILSAALFVPVPFSRVYLGDHTPLQVGIGAADGAVLGVLYFALLRFVLAPRLDAISARLAAWTCGGVHLANDFAPQRRLSILSAALIEEQQSEPHKADDSASRSRSTSEATGDDVDDAIVSPQL
ncbi:hypothetical protein ATCC90586_008409 [Pythium insidiosum]|nr:hypothetical protein ATCC90586_008409 [Pythium insidiosum]